MSSRSAASKRYVRLAGEIASYRTLTTTLAAVGLLVVATSMVGLANTLTMTVLERTREIGILRSSPKLDRGRVEPLRAVVDAVTGRGPGQGRAGRPAVLAVDGRSNNGKSTLAARIGRLVPGSVVVHTDDIAGEHSRFGWADLLINGFLVPAHQGRPVRYRPPRWEKHGRAGAIEVPAGCPLMITEGVGARRHHRLRHPAASARPGYRTRHRTATTHRSPG